MLGYIYKGIRLHGEVLSYMVECWVTWWRVLGYIVGSVGLYHGQYMCQVGRERGCGTSPHDVVT